MDTKPELIHDWNLIGGDVDAPRAVEFDDETLRDGLQSPSVTDPPVDRKVRLLHWMDRLGIHSADLGLPGAGKRAVRDVSRLAREIRDARLKIAGNCAARTMVRDIEPIAAISQEVGIQLEVCAFIGSSPIRQYVEDWTLERLLHHTEEAVRFTVGENLPCTYVTEDTTRAHPDTLRALFRAAIGSGARRLCLCDTVGHATPAGVRALVQFTRELVNAEGGGVAIDWHGHNDRGLGLINTLTAIDAGVDRVHGTALGVGERVGNTPLDQVLINLKLMGWIDNDLTALAAYCREAADAAGLPIPINYPVVGDDAFRTGTGVHAAAVIKAMRKGDRWLSDLVYSGVPAHLVGLEQVIEIGPMSGASNVVYWLEKNGYEPTEGLVERIFQTAKQSSRVLSSEEIEAMVTHEQTAKRP